MIQDGRECNWCRTWKPTESFYKRKDRPGLVGICRECRSERNRRPGVEPRPCGFCGVQYTPTHRDGIYCSDRCSNESRKRAAGHIRRSPVVVNGEKRCNRCLEWKPVDQDFSLRKTRRSGYLSECKKCVSARSRTYNTSEHGRNARYARKYGVTLEWYESTLKGQAGVCAICGSPPDSGSTVHPKLAIDHDHATGSPRGLLCFICNSALGKFRDDPALLQRAIDYLVRHRSPLT